jgi:acetoin utilization deacetylase AcuC-like enzyme
MLPFKLVYSDDYFLPIGMHVFPAQKYRLIHQRLLETGVAAAEDFVTPEPARDEDVLLVHTPEYVHKLKTGTLSTEEELTLEIPYSPELVRAFWLAAGGSILAARLALRDQVAISIGGGFHHAFPNHGEGFCMIHDVAVAIRRLLHDGAIQRAMTVDCDVHQGNGTAAIFSHELWGRDSLAEEGGALPSWSTRARHPHPAHMLDGPPPQQAKTGLAGDPAPSGEVFTISLHQQNNYPAWKPHSSIDVNLPDGTGDDDYLMWLDNALSAAFRRFEPQLIGYIAGADPYKEDQLGGLGLTVEGLKRRDDLMFRAARARGIPVMVTLAGGYAVRVEDTVTIHCNTVVAAREVIGKSTTETRTHGGSGKPG